MTAEQRPAEGAPPKPKRRLLDLDAIEAEANGQPLELQLRGKLFTLSAAMPIGLPIFLNRAFKAEEPAEEDRQVLAAVEAIFGDRADEALRAGFTLAHLVKVADSYGLEATVPESPASAPSSKPTGKRSRRTSKPTTDSTSASAASGLASSASAASSPS